ncbi:uncharacterized protein LOC126564540 [Anopheles maculipalpis]|uniref:uncharacterized protein LOC126564540 n=1 Tax=Anopheles maculipalpis TaxID=1496333 RepID=UPI002159202C|nr:uncharacterized protein LOC126564540 [Anopheles maculipalpis]
MKRNSSHFHKLRVTGQLYKMSARRKALEKSMEQQSENADPESTVDCLPKTTIHLEDTENIQTIDDVLIIETSDGCTGNTYEASCLDEDNDWMSQDDYDENDDHDDEDGEEIISSGGVSQFQNMELKEALQYWALTNYQSRSSVNMMPEQQTSRTPLNISAIEGGRYLYNGVNHCLINRLEHVNVPENISINVSIDGLPLFKGSPSLFLPILINVLEIPFLSPMIVAMFHGITKPPQLQEFLAPFVKEMNDVIENGIQINNQIVHVALRAFICDAPASWTEYSSFLHYASLVVLKDNLSKKTFDHFLLLFCAVTILSSRAYEEYWAYAGQLLYKFVTQFDSVRRRNAKDLVTVPQTTMDRIHNGKTAYEA